MTTAIYYDSVSPDAIIEYQALEDFAKQQEGEVIWYQEGDLTKKNLADLKKDIKVGRIKTLALWSFVGLHLTIVPLEKFLNLVDVQEVRVIELEHDIDTATEDGQTFLRLLDWIAECEHRVKGLTIALGCKEAKANGSTFPGRQDNTPTKILPEVRERIIRARRQRQNVREIARRERLSHTWVYRILKDAGF